MNKKELLALIENLEYINGEQTYYTILEVIKTLYSVPSECVMFSNDSVTNNLLQVAFEREQLKQKYKATMLCYEEIGKHVYSQLTSVKPTMPCDKTLFELVDRTVHEIEYMTEIYGYEYRDNVVKELQDYDIRTGL